MPQAKDNSAVDPGYKTITTHVRMDQHELLHRLSAETKVPVAEYIRQGIDLILESEHATSIK